LYYLQKTNKILADGGVMKIAIFDLTDCEGCELQFLTLKEKLLELFENYEVANWRLLQEKGHKTKYDIAIVTGTPVKQSERDLLKMIRSQSKYLVALGYCATSGGIQGWVKPEERQKITEYVYNKKYKPLATEAKPISCYVKVDKEIPGCPANVKALEEFIKNLPQLNIEPIRKQPSKPGWFIPDYITKIEGHATLKVDLQHNKARLIVEEGERLIEGILLQRDFQKAPWVTSRICGVCPQAHNLASIKAIENALGISPNDVVVSLRKILLYAQIIQSHLFHLFFLSLPDFWNAKSGIDLAKEYPAEFHLVLNLKRTTEKILQTVGGQVIHPTNTTVGGFINLPRQEELLGLLSSLEDTIDEARDLIKLFIRLKYPQLNRKREYLAMEDYYNGTVFSSQKRNFPPQEYKREIQEKIIPNSTAKIGQRDKGGFMVGALARLNLGLVELDYEIKQYLTKSGIILSNHNPFLNNLAQAIEIYNLYQKSIKEINNLTSLKASTYQKAGIKEEIKIKAGEGVGSVEAPRGTLYHYYQIDKKGKIQNADILTPTVQNLSNIEEDIQRLLLQHKEYSREKKIKLVEMLIRAYDPCITCAVH